MCRSEAHAFVVESSGVESPRQKQSTPDDSVAVLGSQGREGVIVARATHLALPVNLNRDGESFVRDTPPISSQRLSPTSIGYGVPVPSWRKCRRHPLAHRLVTNLRRVSR